jgi:transcriptional regulator with XRE-family HTH domain
LGPNFTLKIPRLKAWFVDPSLLSIATNRPDAILKGMSTEDFANRLRRLRLEAHLSQADLALGLIDSSHISLLESGKRGPSPKLVEQLAERLGVSPRHLKAELDEEVAESRRRDFLFAEIALQNGDFGSAESLLRLLLAEPGVSTNLELSLSARHLYARALEGLGRLEEATQELRQSISVAQQSGFPLEATEMTIDLCRCLRESGNFLQELDLLTAAQESFPPELRNSVTYARLISTAIGTHYMRGDYVLAQKLVDDALSAFDSRTNPAAQAAILWNASLVADANKETGRAIMLAQRAAALYAECNNRRSEGKLRITVSWLFTRQVPPAPAAAREQLELAAVLLQNCGTPVDIAHLETELARVEWLDANYKETLRNASSAISRLDGSNNYLESAHAYLQAARAQISLGHEIESAMNLQAAHDLLSRMDPSPVNSLAWRELGDTYLERDLKTEALIAYKEALNSAGLAAYSVTAKDTKKAGLVAHDEWSS